MEQGVKRVVEDVARGEILLFLRNLYPEGATPSLLRNWLDTERGTALDERKLTFYLRYLTESGLVSCELFPRRRAGEPEQIRLVKITKAGIDEIDGRQSGSSGVSL
jgi:hypothetical protein